MIKVNGVPSPTEDPIEEIVVAQFAINVDLCVENAAGIAAFANMKVPIFPERCHRLALPGMGEID